MPRKAKPLTALEVGRISAPGMHPVGTVDGLYLVVKPSGARSWILRILAGGRRREVGLGGFPAVTLAMAHQRARETRDKVLAGIDPVAERRQARSALMAAHASAVTFAEATAKFLDAHGDSWRNPKHRAQWSATLETYAFPKLGKLLVRDIAKEHVLEVLNPIWREVPETASRVRGRIEQVISFAVQAGYRPEGLNPARWKGNLDLLLAARSKVARVKHHRALPYRGMGDFMVRLRAAEGLGARALKFVILTACRSGEVRGATWGEIDLAAKTWTIPAERMKAGREHRVPLSRQAVELLRDLPRIDGCDLAFPSSKGKPLSDMTLSAVMRRLKVDAVPHGFRSAFRDWAGEQTNYPHDVIELSLAHTVGSKVELAYKRGDLFEKRRRLLQEWADYCDRPSAQAGSVTPIRGAA